MVSMSAAIDQYEETTVEVIFNGYQNNLLGSKGILEHQDEYVFYQEESVYLQEFAYFKQDCCRNGSYTSNIGVTG
jgi:hypothetical protein